MTPATIPLPSQPQQEPTPVANITSQGRKAKKKDSKDKAPQAPPAPKAPMPCTLCEVVGNATRDCPEPLQLKLLVHEGFLESNILEVHVDIPVPPKKLKMLHTNYPYPFLIFMVTIHIVSLVSTSFTIDLGRFVNTMPLVIEPLLLYLWILVQPVNQNKETLVPLL